MKRHWDGCCTCIIDDALVNWESWIWVNYFHTWLAKYFYCKKHRNLASGNNHHQVWININTPVFFDISTDGLTKFKYTIRRCVTVVPISKCFYASLNNCLLYTSDAADE